MTPENLRRLADLCGYKDYQPPTGSQCGYYLSEALGILTPWNPFTSIADAWDVMRAMREQRFSVRIPFMELLHIEVSKRIITAPALHGGMLSLHPSAVPLYMELADICNAALLALDEPMNKTEKEEEPCRTKD